MLSGGGRSESITTVVHDFGQNPSRLWLPGFNFGTSELEVRLLTSLTHWQSSESRRSWGQHPRPPPPRGAGTARPLAAWRAASSARRLPAPRLLRARHVELGQAGRAVAAGTSEGPAGQLGRRVKDLGASCTLQSFKKGLAAASAGLRRSSGRLRYMISCMISRNYDIAYDIICLELSMIS